jgi:hypothetical protein
MAKVIAKYQVKVPSVLMEGAEVIELEPIKLETDIGKVIIYPPGSKERKPKSYTKPQKGFYRVEVKVEGKDSQLWNADTLWVDIEAEVTSILSEKEIRDRLDTKTHEVVYQFLKLLRRKLPEAPLFLPISLRPSVDYDLSQVLKEKGHIFRAAATPFTFKIVSAGAGLTKDKWTELQQEMSSGEYTKLYEDFIADSKAALDEDDLNRATLYATIGCEIFIKEYTEKSAKEKGISQIFWEYLKDPNTETRVRTYYDQVLHLVKGHSMKKENKETYNRLDRIFYARNKIMHEGKIPPSWNRDKINQLREDIREVEQIISWVLEL